jgi:hypothetical protein
MPTEEIRAASSGRSTDEHEAGTESSDPSEGSEAAPSTGPLSERLDRIEPLLLEFGTALGGEPESRADLPFTEVAGTDEMPPELYVRHDDAMLNQVTSWLLEDQHIGLASPHGTGKSALREVVERDLGDRADFVVATLDNPAHTTERGVYERVLRAAADAGYEIDPDDYWQLKDGVPWSTQETETAVREVTGQARADDTTLLLVVDECEDLDPDLTTPLQTAADAGVRLFLLGTPAARTHLQSVRETLDARLHYYDGIDPFDADAVAEYVGRSLAAFRGEAYDPSSVDLFSGDAIRFVLEETGGNPRQVRMACLDLFTRAAFLWDRVGVDIERVTITSALADRELRLSGDVLTGDGE